MSKKKKKKHIILKIVIIVILVIAALIIKRGYDLNWNWLAMLMGHNKETRMNLEPMEVLILGESTGSTDTMLVCKYNPKEQKASILSIPRDTFVGEDTNSARPENKINSFYMWGGEEKTLEAVNKTTGLDTKYYILIDTNFIKELVDVIGGIDFDVPIDMKYTDKKQKLYIKLKKGKQHLNGEQVEWLVRFRHNNDGSTYPYEYGIEDYGRMRTQRAVMKIIAKQAIQLKNITEINNMLDIFHNNVKTNMDIKELKDYVPYAMEMNIDEVPTEQLPGESKILNGIWFFLKDDKKSKDVIDKLFKNNSNEENKDQNNTSNNNTN